MIPLGYFLIAWIVLLGIHGLLTAFTVMQMLKHGVPGFATYFSTFIFILVTGIVVLGSASYFITVDWQEKISPLPSNIMQIFQQGEEPMIIDIPLE